MTKQYNNKDNQFEEVTNLLKELPNVTAPPDFEMNLRRKINNLKYSQEKAVLPKFSFKKALIPVTTLATSVIVFFIIFNQTQNKEVENPFTAVPKLRVEVDNTIPEVNNENLLINPRNVTSNDVVIESSSPAESPVILQKQESMADKNNNSSVTQSRNIASGERSRTNARPFNFEGYENDVDQSLRARPGDYSTNSYYGNGQNVNFGGFNIIQGDGRDVEQLRARMDSIKRWMKENR